MAEAEGVPPKGGAPSARPVEPERGSRDVVESSGVEPAPSPSPEHGEPGEPGARSFDVTSTGSPEPTGERSGEPAVRPPVDGDPALDDPLAPYRPAEPTLLADPVVREFDVPVDTGQLRRISTGQLLVVHRPEYDQREVVEQLEQRRAYSWVAAVTGIIGATASLFVGWMLPLSIAAIVFGVLGLRREEHGRTLAFIGIGTGLGGLVFSALWIGYYAIVFGALPA
ncbi:hypothetical protein [Agromyces sp. NPDC058064]|uniref:DUF4190 domain-containing protein n=1 Tax=Agromyces sp. NPDC058064 TaxID=3346322 RepID=UPI0036D8BC62